jgi:hypothetical protein
MFRSFIRRGGVALAATAVAAVGLSGLSVALAAPAFANAPVPTITAVSTNATYTANGPYTGGTTVTVTGTGFIPTGTAGESTTFAFGANAGTSVNCTSTTTCTVVSPAVSASPTVADETANVDITATSNNGTGPSTSATSSADKFQYTPPSASLLEGSGSQTSWFEMQELSNAFNTQPGCDITSSISYSAELNCGTSTFAPGTPLGEQGLTIGADNPYNDYTVQESAIGSGNGATQELAQGQQGIAPAQYFRASAPKGNSTVNRVAYAIDGQSWIHFTSVNGTATPSAKVKNISLSQLNAIYNNTLTCTYKGKTLTDDWYCLGAKKPAHIDCYDAQTGSGTYSTWTSSGNVPDAAYTQGVSVPPCANDLIAGDGTAASHVNIPENQVASIYTSANKDAANAIYYFSYGKFQEVCPGGKCQGTGTKSPAALGEITGRVSGTPTTIDSTTIESTNTSTQWPIIRYLYNDYNNSSSSDPANQATLNFTSELGWLCKASTASETDPNTGGTERATIDGAIEAGGFLPIEPNGVNAPFATGSNAPSYLYPAQLTDPGYVANDGSNGATTGDSGYCLVTIG